MMTVYHLGALCFTDIRIDTMARCFMNRVALIAEIPTTQGERSWLKDSNVKTKK